MEWVYLSLHLSQKTGAQHTVESHHIVCNEDWGWKKVKGERQRLNIPPLKTCIKVNCKFQCLVIPGSELRSKSLPYLGWLLSTLVNLENKLALFFVLVKVWSTTGYSASLAVGNRFNPAISRQSLQMSLPPFSQVTQVFVLVTCLQEDALNRGLLHKTFRLGFSGDG